MKPVIIIENIEDGFIRMKPELFKKYIDEAYQSGFNDGRKSKQNITYPLGNEPYVDPEPYRPSITWDHTCPDWQHPNITCDTIGE